MQQIRKNGFTHEQHEMISDIVSHINTHVDHEIQQVKSHIEISTKSMKIALLTWIIPLLAGNTFSLIAMAFRIGH